METADEVLDGLRGIANEGTRKVLLRHGAPETLFGVRIGDMKKHLLKKVKGNQDLALQLFDTEQPDAMYLAGLAADGSQMTKTQLNRWAKLANWYLISEHSVPGVAAENAAACDLALKWMKSRTEHIAAAGWATYSAVLSIRPDEDLDQDEILGLLKTVETTIHDSPNRVRNAMNNFVICVGTYIPALTSKAKSVAAAVGKVSVDVGETACKVPDAVQSIQKVEKMGRVGRKRKTAKC